MQIRTQYDRNQRSTAPEGGPQITKQSFKDEVDINTITERYRRTGQLPPGVHKVARFGEVSSASYHDMMNQVADINSTFDSLPARLRARFQNNPYQLLRFVENPVNAAEAVKLGLLNLVTDEGKPAVRTSEEVAAEAAAAAAAAAKTAPQSDPEAQPRGGKKAE